MGKKSKKLMFRLILVGLLTGSSPGCYQSQGSDAEPDGGDGVTDFDVETDVDEYDTGSEEPVDTDPLGDHCDDWEMPHKREVPSMEPGVEPVPAKLCDAGDTVESNRAAAVTLNIYSQSLHLATGQVVVAEQLEGQIEGVPEIEVVLAWPKEMKDAIVSNIEPAGMGFSFNIEFPETIRFHPGGNELTLQVTLKVKCPNEEGETRMVESTTYFYLCEDEEHPNWVGSGGECLVCEAVCEMVASPMPAAHREDPLPLAGSPRAEIVPLASFDRSVILSAELRDTQGKVSYTWSAQAGTVSSADCPTVLWELPREAGPHLIQVVVEDEHSATVAAFRWRHTT